MLPQPTEELASDIAQQLISPAEIADKHTTTEKDIIALMAHDGFRIMVAQHRAEWLASDSADTRVRLKAKLAEESALLDIHEIIKDPMTATSDRIAAYKAIQTSSGATAAGRKSEAPGEISKGINVQINLNGERHELSFDVDEVKSDPLELEAL